MIVSLVAAIEPSSYDMGKVTFTDITCGSLVIRMGIKRDRFVIISPALNTGHHNLKCLKSHCLDTSQLRQLVILCASPSPRYNLLIINYRTKFAEICVLIDNNLSNDNIQH